MIAIVLDAATGETYQVEIPDEPPQQPIPPTIDDYRQAVRSRVEATAQSRAYDSAASCASYVASTVPQWAAEAQSFVAWRDGVWSLVYDLLETHDPDNPHSIQDVLDLIPEIEWP